MPFVKIDLFEGRSEEQKIELAREVTEVVSRVAKAPDVYKRQIYKVCSPTIGLAQ